MNILDLYSAVHNYSVKESPVPVYKPPEEKSVHILTDVKSVTIAEINPASRDMISAHRLKDYRRKTFSLLLLPDISLPIDSFMGDIPDIRTMPGFEIIKQVKS